MSSLSIIHIMAYPGSQYYGGQAHGGGQYQEQQYGYEQPPPQQYQQQYEYEQPQQNYGYDQRGAPPPPPTEYQNFGETEMQFQYSDLRGKRKALLIGINYIGSDNQLNGCINECVPFASGNSSSC